jgi:Holliday junction resolvase RusA-like endonuclease
MKIVLTEQIPSGKNAQGIAKNGRRYAKPRFINWREAASYEIMLQKRTWPTVVKMALPLRGDCVVTISYREIKKVPANGVRDVPGMLDALWHLLAHMELIEHDGQIKGVTWVYPWRTEGPCVEMEIRKP